MSQQTIPAHRQCCATCSFWGGDRTYPRLGSTSHVRVFALNAKCSRLNVLRTPNGGGGNCPYYAREYKTMFMVG